MPSAEAAHIEEEVHGSARILFALKKGRGRAVSSSSGVERSPSKICAEDHRKIEGLSPSAKAGLHFPVDRIGDDLRDGQYAARMGAGAPVYMAAVLEYLTAEVLELAGNAANETSNDNNIKARISPEHIAEAVRNDEELRCMMNKNHVAPQSPSERQATYGGVWTTSSTRAREVFMRCVKRQQEEESKSTSKP